MKKSIGFMTMMIAMVFLFSYCSKQSENPADYTKQVTDEVTAESDKLLKAIETLNVDAIFAFFNTDAGTICQNNGTTNSVPVFRQIITGYFPRLNKEKLTFDKPVIKVLAPDAALLVCSGRLEAELKTGEKNVVYTAETYLWKKINGKWLIDFMHESLITMPDDELKKETELAVTEFAKELGKTELKNEELNKLMNGFLTKYPNVFGTAIALQERTVNGKPQKHCVYLYHDAATLKEVLFDGSDYMAEDWYKNPVKEKKSLWSTPYYDSLGGKCWMITYSVPIYKEGSGELLGVVTGDALTGMKRITR